LLKTALFDKHPYFQRDLQRSGHPVMHISEGIRHRWTAAQIRRTSRGRREDRITLTTGIDMDEALQEMLAETDPADCAG
jgi:hypothetical protein